MLPLPREVHRIALHQLAVPRSSRLPSVTFYFANHLLPMCGLNFLQCPTCQGKYTTLRRVGRAAPAPLDAPAEPPGAASTEQSRAVEDGDEGGGVTRRQEAGSSRHRHGVVIEGLGLLAPALQGARSFSPFACRFPLPGPIPLIRSVSISSSFCFPICDALQRLDQWMDRDAATASDVAIHSKLAQLKREIQSGRLAYIKVRDAPIISLEFRGKACDLGCSVVIDWMFISLAGEGGDEQEGAAAAHLRVVRYRCRRGGSVQGHGWQQHTVAARRRGAVQAHGFGP